MKTKELPSVQAMDYFSISRSFLPSNKRFNQFVNRFSKMSGCKTNNQTKL